MSNVNVIKSRTETPAIDVTAKNKYGDPICYGTPTVVKTNDTVTNETITDKNVSEDQLSQLESNELYDHQPEIICTDMPTMKTPTFDELLCIMEKPSLTKPSTSIEKPGQGVTEMNRSESHEKKQLNYQNEKTSSTDISKEKTTTNIDFKPSIFDVDVKSEMAANDATTTKCTVITKETTTMKQELAPVPLKNRDEPILVASNEIKTIRLNSSTSLIPVSNPQSINKLR